jgi:phage-related minor tail protein
MSNDPRIEIGVQLNTGDLDAQIRTLRRRLSALESEGVTIDVDINIDNIAAAESLLHDIGGNATIDVDVTANDTELDAIDDRIADIDAASASVTVSASDSDLDVADDKIADIDAATATVDINANDDELSDAESTLTQIRNLAVIDVTFTVGKAALDVAGSALSGLVDISGVSGLFEMNEALRRIQITTGEMMPGARELINDIYTNGWGESRTQIAEVLALASQLNIPADSMQTAIEGAFIAAEVGGEDVNVVLERMRTLVNTGLVEDYDHAADVIVTGFQDGANAGDDLLDTLNEYATSLQQAGVDAEYFIATATRGQELGIDNADRLADAFREFGIKIREGGDDVEGALEKLDLTQMRDDFVAGRIDGETFMNSVRDGLQGIEDPLERNQTAVALFGTQFEDFSVDTFLTAMEAGEGAMNDVEGAADRAGDTISTGIPAALERAKRLVTTRLGEFLDEQFDISGFIGRVEEGLNTFFDMMQNGASFEEALGVSLEIAGLADLQSSLADFVLDLMTGLANVIDAIGDIPGISTDSSNIRDVISRLGESQLQIELAAGGDSLADFDNILRQAIERGVSTSDISTLLTSSLGAAMETGDFDMVGQILGAAQSQGVTVSPEELQPIVSQYTDAINSLLEGGDYIGAFDLSTMLMGSIDAAAVDNQAIRSSIMAIYNDAVSDATIDTSEVGAVLDASEMLGMPPPAEVLEQINAMFDEIVASGDLDLASRIAEMTGDEEQSSIIASLFPEEDAERATETATQINDDMTAIGETAVTTGESVVTSNQEVATAQDELGMTTSEVTSAMETDWDALTLSVQNFATTAEIEFNRIGEVWSLTADSMSISIALLSGQLEQLGFNMSAVGNMNFSGFGGGGTTINNNNTLNQTNNVQSGAQGASVSAATVNAFTSGG